MRKTLLIAVALAGAMFAGAQSLNISLGNVNYLFSGSTMGDAVLTGGAELTVQGRTFNAVDIASMRVVADEIADNTVAVSYDSHGANVTIAGNIAQYVDATVSGAHVSITQSPEVGADTSGEITYVLSGESSNGSLVMTGTYKATIELRGLTLHNPQGAAIDIQNGKRIDMSVKSGTVIKVSDGADGSQKGALVCKGHLELKGKGSLTISGNKAHAISAKEYVTVKNCTLIIDKAVKDGINCAQYFAMESGTLSISGTGDDGIQVDFKDDADREEEDTGSVTITGGMLNVGVTADAAKCIKAEGDITISGGELTLIVSGNGIWDSAKSKTKASSCLSADGDMNITGGSISLTATGHGGKGASCDGTFTIEAGSLTVKTSGGVVAYVNNKLYNGYTGNTDNIASDRKSSPKGVKADTNIVINGGTIDVTTTGKGGEGIESKGELTVNDGNITVHSYDDGINSSSHMHINGGDIMVIATNNDGLDSNGNMYINGGYCRLFGTRVPECGIDANEEEGYSVIFKGGTLLAVGSRNSTPRKSESTQPYVEGTGSAKANTQITLKDGTTELATFTVPEEFVSNSGGGFPAPGGPGGGSNGSILITCPGLISGSSYTLTNGTTNSTVKARLTGSSGFPTQTK